jgi:general secretion pathway protein A
MYEAFYGFKEKPFSLLPDPDFLYLGKKHAMALAMLQYSLLHRVGITVLSGEIGSGKTTLIRYLLNQIGEDFNVGLISHTHRKFGDLLQWINMAYGLDFEKKTKVALYQQLIDYLVERYTHGQYSLMIIDEAQNLDYEALEAFRLLSNVNAGKDQILQLMLIGQPELREKLKQPVLEQFIQRIGVAYHLKPFSREETDAYICHRLTVAGGDPRLFEPIAMRFIHHQSGGIPRLVNVLCDTSLVYGYADKKKPIDIKTVYAVVQDKIRSGLFARRKIEGLREEPGNIEIANTPAAIPKMAPTLSPSSVTKKPEMKDAKISILAKVNN